MGPALLAAFQQEMTSARQHHEQHQWSAAFSHLERAHILSQRYTFAHVSTHLWMMRVGWARRDAREVTSQLVRAIAASFFSKIWVPLGNTGGANVSAFKPMEIPADLKALLETERRGSSL